jgi:tRNA threonylcarbamoyladenosine biosynthesis protein TsaE
VKRFLADDAATAMLAEELLAELPQSIAGWTILLSGELGAGKSTFARAFIRKAGHHGAIPSPTYTLVEPYQTPAGSIYHVDLYRVAAVDELRFIGWNELDDGCRLVEWPDRAPGLAAAADLVLTLAYAETGRGAEFQGLSERGIDVLRRMSVS